MPNVSVMLRSSMATQFVVEALLKLMTKHSRCPPAILLGTEKIFEPQEKLVAFPRDTKPFHVGFMGSKVMASFILTNTSTPLELYPVALFSLKLRFTDAPWDTKIVLVVK